MSRPTTHTLFAFGYLLVAVTMWIRGGRVRRDAPVQPERFVWCALAVVVASAGVLRWFSAGDRISSVLRDRARSVGWYGNRSSAQIGAMIGLLLLGAAVIWVIVSARRRGLRTMPIPTLIVVGLAVAIGLAATRIVSLHRLDALLTREVVGVRVMTFVEFGALTMMLVGVVRWHVDEVDNVSDDARL